MREGVEESEEGRKGESEEGRKGVRESRFTNIYVITHNVFMC